MKPLPGGGTVGDGYKGYRKAHGKPHPEDRDQVKPPQTILYLWEWFWECSTGRPIGPEGIPLAIPPSEMAAWAQLRRVTLTDWELTALQGLDATFLKVSAEKVFG